MPRPRRLWTASQYGSDGGGGSNGWSTSFRHSTSGWMDRSRAQRRSRLSSCSESRQAWMLAVTTRSESQHRKVAQKSATSSLCGPNGSMLHWEWELGRGSRCRGADGTNATTEIPGYADQTGIVSTGV
eukprot:scaffold35_cov116-Isochrysis_galbana.AAC.3